MRLQEQQRLTSQETAIIDLFHLTGCHIFFVDWLCCFKCFWFWSALISHLEIFICLTRRVNRCNYIVWYWILRFILLPLLIVYIFMKCFTVGRKWYSLLYSLVKVLYIIRCSVILISRTVLVNAKDSTIGQGHFCAVSELGPALSWSYILEFSRDIWTATLIFKIRIMCPHMSVKITSHHINLSVIVI